MVRQKKEMKTGRRKNKIKKLRNKYRKINRYIIIIHQISQFSSPYSNSSNSYKKCVGILDIRIFKMFYTKHCCVWSCLKLALSFIAIENRLEEILSETSMER